ncbi:MAG TPA: hypothetical protein VJH95_03145 [Candidatus Nanoarchaeia archaeon]|nr:hypothetical protein [Candidatus Nanoarchaeia archaeon]
MGKIFGEIGLLGAKNKFIKVKALFDTGAESNYISKTFGDGSSIYDLGILEFEEETPVIFPDGNEIKGRMIKLKLLKIEGTVPIQEPRFCLFDMRLYEVIIGAKLMQQVGIVLNPYKKEINFNGFNSPDTPTQ